MAQYRKKPGIRDAVLWDGGNLREIKDEFGLKGDEYKTVLSINTPPGKKPKRVLLIWSFGEKVGVFPGTWVVKGLDGKLYPMKPDIFEETYEKVDGYCLPHR